jgi:hypothetical protein
MSRSKGEGASSDRDWLQQVPVLGFARLNGR